MFINLSLRQYNCVQKSNTIGLSSVCIATVCHCVPKVKSGEWADVPKVEFGEQRINQMIKGYSTTSASLCVPDGIERIPQLNASVKKKGYISHNVTIDLLDGNKSWFSFSSY